MQIPVFQDLGPHIPLVGIVINQQDFYVARFAVIHFKNLLHIGMFLVSVF